MGAGWTDGREHARALDEVRELAAGQVSTDPEDLRWQRALLMSQNMVGDILVEQGKSAPALQMYQAAYSTSQHLALVDP